MNACPGLTFRALAFDDHGVIKVIQAGNEEGAEDAYEFVSWGQPDEARCVLAASLTCRDFNQLLAVARTTGEIEVRNPINGAVYCTRRLPEAVIGLHAFANNNDEYDNARFCKILSCSKKGHARVQAYELSEIETDDISLLWNVGSKGNIICSKVHQSETYSVFGGENVGLCLCNVSCGKKDWIAEPHALWQNQPDTSITSVTFWSEDNPHLVAAGTNKHDVCLFDTKAGTRPVKLFDIWFKTPKELMTPIQALTEDVDGNTIYAGTSSGDLFSLDLRKDGELSYFRGPGLSSYRFEGSYEQPTVASSGSIRFIMKHPQHPLVASGGALFLLDGRCLNIWSTTTKELRSKVIMEHKLTDVVFDRSPLGEAGNWFILQLVVELRKFAAKQSS